METEEITRAKRPVIPLKFFLISVNRRKKTVAAVGARTWPSLLVTIPVWLLLFPASYVHMCYTPLMYQRKEHLSFLAFWGEQTEHAEAASLHLFVDCVTVAGPGKFPGVMDIFLSFRGFVFILTADRGGTSLIRRQLNVVTALLWDDSLCLTDQSL